jgi:quinol monooxygenase YgiN
MIIATRIYTVNAENREQAIAEMIKAARISRQSAGIITHSFYADLDDPTAVRFYGEFETVAALETQIKSEHEVAYKEVMAKIGVIAGPGTVSRYTAVPEYPFK